jgi:hypothetical protein
MNTKTKEKKDFDTVETFRQIKEKISKDIKGMDYAQLTEYLNRTTLNKATNNPSS